MSGKFEFTPADQLPKHAHLQFYTCDRKQVLSFVDYRRFGRWFVNGDWGKDRGPCVITEYLPFRQNVLDHLEQSAFDRPICEAMLNQKYFNGVGNYLRAEVLFRLGVKPFDQARKVLTPLLVKKEETKIEGRVK
jgi:endonuclease VIII-like 1